MPLAPNRILNLRPQHRTGNRTQQTEERTSAQGGAADITSDQHAEPTHTTTIISDAEQNDADKNRRKSQRLALQVRLMEEPGPENEGDDKCFSGLFS